MTGRIAIGAIGLAVLSLAACSTGTTQCDCADPGATISIPTDVAASVLKVVLSGPACAGVEPTCVNQAGGCSQYRFGATGPGACHVEVDFADGHTFGADVTFGASSQSCCTGFYATPPSAAQISVPAPDGG